MLELYYFKPCPDNTTYIITMHGLFQVSLLSIESNIEWTFV